ncbi:TPA: hypothetical protein H1012_01030 [archaeon]|nr:hypothetical protein [Candidatus Naiadarchaeales archaeon SRR2090159.bin1288]
MDSTATVETLAAKPVCLLEVSVKTIKVAATENKAAMPKTAINSLNPKLRCISYRMQ